MPTGAVKLCGADGASAGAPPSMVLTGVILNALSGVGFCNNSSLIRSGSNIHDYDLRTPRIMKVRSMTLTALHY
jgi:hypothetical protein